MSIELMRNQIFKDLGVLLPISGGIGNSIENAIVIEKTDVPFHTAVWVSYTYLDCIFNGRNVTYERIGQALLGRNGKKIDKISCITKELTETQIITQTENYYFDITQFW